MASKPGQDPAPGVTEANKPADAKTRGTAPSARGRKLGSRTLSSSLCDCRPWVWRVNAEIGRSGKGCLRPRPHRSRSQGSGWGPRAEAFHGQPHRSQSWGVPRMEGLPWALLSWERLLLGITTRWQWRYPAYPRRSSFPHLESLQKLLGADAGWRLRLQAGRHPVPDRPGVQGDRQRRKTPGALRG